MDAGRVAKRGASEHCYDPHLVLRYSRSAQASSIRVRTRIEKIAHFALHAARARRRRRELETLAAESPVARALVAFARDQFTAEERRVLASIEKERMRLFARHDSVVWRIEVPMDPATAPPAAPQVVGRGARVSSVKPHWGTLLYTLAREIKPAFCIELGTGFGVSGLYIQAGQQRAGSGRFVTFEGSKARAAIASEMHQRLGFHPTIVVGDFDRTVAREVATLGTIDFAFVDGNHRGGATIRYDALIRRHGAAGTVVVHDDIRWSSDMEAAWLAVLRAPGGRRAFDLFRLGILELGAVLDLAPPRLVEASLGLAHAR